MKILLIGVFLDPKNVSKYKGVSTATNNWQYQLVSNISNNVTSISVISYVSEKSWPFGKLFPKIESKDLENTFISDTISYINLPLIREFSIYLNVKKVLKNKSIYNTFDYIMTFNSLLRNNLINKYINRNTNRISISITGDGKISEISKISIIQNYNSYLNSKKTYKYFFQGGVPSIKVSDLYDFNNSKIIVFTGTFTNLTGIEKFAMQFGNLNIKDLQLHIYGRGNVEYLNSLANKYKNIKIFGYVSTEVLNKAMNEAFAFVNPRNELEESSQNTFPSKLLEYVSFGKPIISTYSSSLDDNFNNLLLLYNSEDENTLKFQLEKIRTMNIDDMNSIREKYLFFIENNSWELKTKELVNYLNNYLSENH